MSSPDAMLTWLTDPARVIDAATQEPDTLEAWWARHGRAGGDLETPIDRAIQRGFRADRIGYAFAAGYQAALRSMVPTLPEDRVVSLCVTEQGGGHPRAIHTKLEKLSSSAGHGYRLTGRKQWSTLSTQATELLIAARIGEGHDGRPRLVLVRVPGDAPGITVTPMPETAFAPEILHGIVELEAVAVADDAVLPGDGYADYMKPFRTTEDLHVHAALAAHLWRLTLRFQWPRTLGAELLTSIVALRSLATADPRSPGVHIAVGGAIEHGRHLVEQVSRHMPLASEEFRTRFERDRALLDIAGSARGKRLERAFEGLIEQEPS